MEQKTDRFYPSEQLENFALEQQLEKKLNDDNSFYNSITNIKEMTTYFEDKNNKSKKKYRNYKTSTTILKSIDTCVIIATTTSSITLSLTGIGLTAIPQSIASACALSIGKKVIHEIIINKYNNHKRQNEKTK